MFKNASLKSLFSFFLFLILSLPALGQFSASETKLIEKTKVYYDKGKYDKAISSIEKVQAKHPFNAQLWYLRVVYENERYNAEYNKVIASIVKQAGSGKEIKVNNTNLSAYKISMLVACLQATMYSEKQEMASRIIRRYLVDPDVDTAVSESARDDFNEGDMEYGNSNWSGAIRMYTKALEKDSNYFNAAYSIGIAYYKDEKYEKAIPWFRRASRIEPGMSNSYIGIADSYIELKKWEEAKEACIDGIIIYPDEAYFVRLEMIAEKSGKNYNRHWQERIITANEITSTQTSPETGPWKYYRSAKNSISDFCNDDGIVKKTISFTQQKYLESYSWEFMLKKLSPDDEDDYKEMAFARKMGEEGFLDCYAFVSCYHVNIHGQYKDFAGKNAERIRTYINTYIFK